MAASATYDLVFSSPYAGYEYFAHYLRQHCGQMRLSFFLVNDVWVHEFLAKMRAGEVKAKVFLDMCTEQAVPDNPYTVLAFEAKEQGAYMIDDPGRTNEICHKGRGHKLLVEKGVPVPETIILDREELAGFRLTDEVKDRLGTPFVVKPAMGYWGGAGVIVDAESEEDIHRSVDQCPKSDTFLIQKRLTMKDLGRHKGWFRMFYICGTVIPCWWDPLSHEYHMVTPAQLKKHKLAPLRKIMRKIAAVSEMKKFSSEICLHEDGRFYAVDYVNSTPDMSPRSFYENGVPDEVIRHVAWLLFYEALHTVKKGKGFFDVDLSEVDANVAP